MTTGFRTNKLVYLTAIVELYWALSIYVFPQEFQAPVYAGLRPYFPYLTSLLMITGVGLMAVQRYAPPTWVKRIMFIIGASPLIWIFLYSVSVNSFAGVVNYGLLAVFLIVAPWLPSDEHGEATIDLHSLFLGAAEVTVAVLVMINPDLFTSAWLSWLRQYPYLYGPVWLAAGVGLLIPVVRLDRHWGRVRLILGALFPLMLAYQSFHQQTWTGLQWVIHVIGLLSMLRPWHRAYGIQGERSSDDFPIVERVSLLVEWCNWLWIAALVVVSALMGNQATSRSATSLFVAVDCVSYALALSLRPVVSLKHLLFGQLAVLSAATGVLLMPQLQPFGHATIAMLVVTPGLTALAMGRRAGYAMIGIVMISMTIGHLLVRDDGSQWVRLFDLAINGSFVAIGAFVTIRSFAQERDLRKEVKDARHDIQVQLEQLRLVERVGRISRQTLDLNQVLQSASMEIGSRFHLSRCQIWLADGAAHAIAVAEWTAPGVPTAAMGLRVPAPSLVLDGPVHGTVIIDNVETDARMQGPDNQYRSFLVQAGVKSWLSTIMRVNGELVGAVTFHQCGMVRTWTPEYVATVEAIGSQLGLAIVHARTHEALTRSYEELTAQQEELYAQNDELVRLSHELAVQRDQMGISLDTAHRAERALARVSHQTDLVLNSAGEGILVIDRDGTIVMANPAAGRMLGYAPEEMLDRSLPGLLHHKDSEGGPIAWEHSAVLRTLAKGEVHQVRAELFRRKGGVVFPVEYISTPILDEGQLAGAVLLFKDITEQRAIERIKDEFISVVSHELRTPLTSIRGSLGLLASGKLGELSDKGVHMLQIAVQNTDRLVRLVNDILDIERIESSKVVMDKVFCMTDDIVRQAAELMQAPADSNGITLNVTGEAILIWADTDRIVRTMTNLLSNAIKFSDRGTTVWLSVERIDTQVLFQVKDEGRGVPADMHESIFERFQQVDASDSREKGGTGLGLAICRSIVEHHGGRIWVESPPGEGATFKVLLPITES